MFHFLLWWPAAASCWCGLWNMADSSVMLSCTQATGPIQAVPDAQLDMFALTEEFDWVELDNGDLLLILRAGLQEGRLQMRLRRQGDIWEPMSLHQAGLPYSGHPELLKTRDGSILHVPTTGISCTRHEGTTWENVELDDGLAGLRKQSATPYYPKSVQLADASIGIFFTFPTPHLAKAASE